MPIMVQISELGFSSPEGVPIFCDFHLQLERSSLLCVVGEPGTGKTLLLSFLCRELRPQRGQILIDNCNILRLSPERFQRLRYRIGIVPQHPQPLLGRTLSGNLCFKLRTLGFSAADATQRARETLQAVGLSAQDDRPLLDLSPGEARVFQLALAICSDPILLLFDDPTRRLSAPDDERVLTALRSIQQRRRLSVLVTSRTPAVADSLGASLVPLTLPVQRPIKHTQELPTDEDEND
jgi:ABC-type methionine transport system ATPase subunit